MSDKTIKTFTNDDILDADIMNRFVQKAHIKEMPEDWQLAKDNHTRHKYDIAIQFKKLCFKF